MMKIDRIEEHKVMLDLSSSEELPRTGKTNDGLHPRAEKPDV